MLLEIRDLSISVQSQNRAIEVVDQVSLSIPRGKVVALVGESGCGKSLTALSILRLLSKPAVKVTGGQIRWNGDKAKFKVQSSKLKRGNEETGQQRNEARIETLHVRPHPLQAPLPVAFSSQGERGNTEFKIRNSKFENGVDLLQLTDREMRAMRGRDISMIFQEPMTALNPVYSVGEQIAEVLILHRSMSKKEAWREAAALLRQVGIAEPERRVRAYPHQLSGGMRQRVLIAMALACRPELLIADEPTTALDVTIQAQILDLLREIRSKTGMSILLITHDLGVVAELADYVYVMYAGRIVEHACTTELFAHPMHPYTQGLFRCTPRLGDSASRLEAIRGSVPDPAEFPTGCRFHPRCDVAARGASATGRHSLKLASGDGVLKRCVAEFEGEPSGVPQLQEATSEHFVACWEARPSH